MENNMTMTLNIPTAHATELLTLLPTDAHFSREEDNIEENNTLTMTQCITGETRANLVAEINRYVETLNNYNMRNLGYPTNQDFNYEAFAPLLDFHRNNAGDPFLGSSFSLNATSFEVAVLNWFANLWEIEKTKYWGYVTTGGTEGNLHGILVGREQLPDGILYTSQDSHYSISKIARMYRMQCVKIGSLVSGEIDCAQLEASLRVNKDKPAIINLNLGTTMKGGIDDLDLVLETLDKCGFTRDRFYIHCDAALFGMMLPFVEQAPKITFKKPIGSVAISGHKFLGCPTACGVVITRLEHMNAVFRDVEIIASRDATIMGSRRGRAPIFLWYALKNKGLMEIKKEVHKCLENARYLFEKLCNGGIGAMLNKFSNIVVFEKPLDEDFTRRWNLACNGNVAHVVVMQHVTIEMLDTFVSEFLQKRSIWSKHEVQGWPVCIANDVGSRNCACSLHNISRLRN